MTRQMIQKIGLVVMGILFLAHSIEAVSIGVSPGTYTFDNMLKNGYAQRTLRITTNSNIPVISTIHLRGEMAEWITFEPNNTRFNMTSSNPYLLKVIARPPIDLPNGTYSGVIDITTESLGETQGRAGSLLRAGVSVQLKGIVVNKEIAKCSAGGFSIKNTEVGYPPDIAFTIVNEGNVRISPKVRFEIWDEEQKNIIFLNSFTAPTLLPTVQETFKQQLPAMDLKIGQYWTTVSIDECGASSLTEFSVVEKGDIIDEGTLEKITNKVWASVGEPVEITATFTNSGSRIVSAKLVGEIRRDGKIVKLIETDETDVDPKQTTDIKTFFAAKDPGKYVVSARIQYNRKRTFEKGSVINVNVTEEKNTSYYLLLLLYLFLLISIAFMIRKILRKRKQK